MTPKTPAPPSASSAADAQPPDPSSTRSFRPEAFRRHAFARLAGDAWRHAVGEPGDPSILRDWLAQGRPLIVRRPCLSADGREVSLGLALPGRRRLAWRVPVACLLSLDPPPLWRGELFRSSGLTLRLFGSHAWQELTGLPYVTPASDIDLLADIASLAEWQRFLSLAITLPASPRVDLEVIFQGDASFSWREFLGPSGDILIKSNRRVWLEHKAHLPALLA